ncbi:MAG: CarD family transcriptional regulator [Deltaproteobacteria bacterium]|nr:CarD family transcriptional regulator [Deltaproteobacteria bacterium]
MFKIGDIAVYPGHGVGSIESVEAKKISGGENQKFYIMRVLGSGATIMVPIANERAVGLRKVINRDTASKIYEILKERNDIPVVDKQTWNRRYREYMDKVKTGCAMEVAKVFRDLYLLKTDKELSFGERRMLDTARTLLVKELSIARKMPEDKIEAEIYKIMNV